RRTALRAGVPLLESYTPIQPILIGDNARALAVSAALQAQGYLVGAIRPPSVPEGQARLRVTLSALHSESDIDGLVRALAPICQPETSVVA
ncbi:MAG: aminotransferase class I/II-fold pyridoxal phosphate-dependent enzyme, partial [Frankiaceae bacterium]|nr:aminotransferase class I/II-fold pyridoxal phosphate-dependent enzyme [Arenimonas sp.]